MAKEVNAHSLVMVALTQLNRGKFWASVMGVWSLIAVMIVSATVTWIVYGHMSLTILHDGTITRTGDGIPTGADALIVVLTFMGRLLGPAALAMCMVVWMCDSTSKRMRIGREKYLDRSYERFNTLKLLSDVLPDVVMTDIRARARQGFIVTNQYMYDVLTRHSNECVGSVLQKQRSILLNQQ